MTKILFLQLPIPQLNFWKRTGNVPLAAACLKQSAMGYINARVDILPESTASYLGDSALFQLFLENKPDIICFSLFNCSFVVIRSAVRSFTLFSRSA